MQTELILPRGYRRKRRVLECSPMGFGLGLGLSFGVSGSGQLPFPSLPSPLGIYRADVATTGATFTWTDQAGTFGNATQSTGANQPTLNASSANFNGKPTLSFNGTSAFLTTANGLSARGQPWTIYAVCKITNAGAGTAVLCDPTNQAPHLLIGNTVGNWYCGNPTTLASANTTTAAMVICAVFNGASSALYVNNSSTPVASGTSGTGGASGGTWTIGALGGGGSLWFGGEMADIDFFGAAHAQTDRGKYFAYVASRYGIAAA